MADSKSGTGGPVSCPRCQKNVNPYKLGGAHDCTPSLAGTAEAMARREVTCSACGHPLSDCDYARLRAECERLRRENALLLAGAPVPLPAPTTISASTARGCVTKVLDAARPHATPEGPDNA